jgi:myo-inositol-1-phosphate synthase
MSAAQVSNISSGRNTPDSQLESIVPVHPTAARRPYLIQVASENTSYSDEFITSKYNDRGASVDVLPDGQLKVTPTVKSFEFQTQKKVPKTG